MRRLIATLVLGAFVLLVWPAGTASALEPSTSEPPVWDQGFPERKVEVTFGEESKAEPADEGNIVEDVLIGVLAGAKFLGVFILAPALFIRRRIKRRQAIARGELPPGRGPIVGT